MKYKMNLNDGLYNRIKKGTKAIDLGLNDYKKAINWVMEDLL